MRYMVRIFRYIDENIEKYVMVTSYSLIAGIIFVEVIRRFLFNQQAPWSTTIPILLFLWLTWFGTSYNVKIRGHLALTELRSRLPYQLQFYALIMDAFLWLLFAGIVIYFSYRQVYLSYDNFAIVEGTDDVMQWWFYMATPLAWLLIAYRAIQRLLRDTHTYKRKEPFVFQAMSDTNLLKKERA